ncbi:MAG: ABC transporter permease [Halothece sp.]
MTFPKLEALLADWVKRSFHAFGEFVQKTLVITEIEARKIRHDPKQLLTRAAQPIVWLGIFGQVFSRFEAIPTGDFSYLDYITPGIVGQSLLFLTIFSGLVILSERDLGLLQKLLVSPTPRLSLVIGKGVGNTLRTLVQSLIIYVLAIPLGVTLNWHFFALIGVIVTILLATVLFSTFSLLIVCMGKTQEGFLGIAQFLTLPVFFTSNAIYPLEMMPPWLQTFALINPLTYTIDALRGLMLVGEANSYPLLLNWGILLGFTLILAALGRWQYPTLVN